MAFCKFCGGQLPEVANNCPNCGAEIPKEQKAQYNRQQQQQNTNIIGADTTSGFDQSDLDSSNKWSYILAYLWILFFLPLVVCPDSKVGRFHANQGLLLLIFSAIVGMVAGVVGGLAWIPVIGGMFGVFSSLLASAGGIVHLAAFIYQTVNILNLKAVELPLIGKFRLIK